MVLITIAARWSIGLLKKNGSRMVKTTNHMVKTIVSINYHRFHK